MIYNSISLHGYVDVDVDVPVQVVQDLQITKA